MQNVKPIRHDTHKMLDNFHKVEKESELSDGRKGRRTERNLGNGDESDVERVERDEKESTSGAKVHDPDMYQINFGLFNQTTIPIQI